MRILFTALLVTFLIGCDQPTPVSVADTPESTPATKEASPDGLGLPAGFDVAEQTIQAANLLKDVSKINNFDAYKQRIQYIIETISNDR